MYVWWFSPLLSYFVLFSFTVGLFSVGEITQERRINYNIRSPLSEPDYLHRGTEKLFRWREIHRRDYYSTLVLPSLNRFGCICWVFFFCSDDGEKTQERRVNYNSRSPLYEPNSCVFNGLVFWPLFRGILWAMIFTMTIGYGVVCIVAWPTILYIYSLGHFLTTKGALIDGDQGGSKNDQKLT